MTDHELIMYSRTHPCPYTRIAKRVLERTGVPYREIYIDQDEDACRRVEAWTGFQSVPTLIVARAGEDVPYAPPQPLDPGTSPKGIDRGTMITEPLAGQLRDWLRRHGFITQL